jgi:hypothetical protein
MTGPDKDGWLAAQSGPPLSVGWVLEFHFPTFTPRVTILSDRELRVEVIAGAHMGFSDTVEFQAVTVREELVMLSWLEHNGTAVVHALDLRSGTTYAAVRAATGEFMRLRGRIDVKSET